MLAGREDESRHIQDLCAAVANGEGRVLIIRGEPGIGKSALLSENTPDHDGVTVVGIRGFASEADLAFAGLHQLVEPFLPLLGGIPGEQARAVRVALGLAEGSTTDLAVCAATLALLRVAAARRPVLLTIDDVHHLDAASLRVVFFCCRRVEGGIGFLLTTLARPGEPQLGEDLPCLVLAGLGAEAATTLLARHGWPRGEAATALVEAARGNPLVLGELARHNTARALDVAALNAGSALDHLFGARLAALSPAERTALRVVAADGTGRADVITRAGERLGLPRDIWGSERLTSLLDTRERIAFAHPLLRSASGLAEPAGLREAHAALAEEWAAIGETSRATWHRALAASEPDEALAAELESSASAAERRGGMASAAVVMRRSAGLSPLPAEGARRLTMAAHYAWKSGEAALARRLLTEGGDTPVPGQRPVRALFELFSGEQNVAFGYLSRCADEAEGTGGADAAADLRFMATGAALYSGRLGEAVELAERIADEHDDPAYRRYGRWLAAALDDRAEPGPRPWRLMDDAPRAIAKSGAHRWLFPMVIAMRGEHVRETHDLAIAAYADLTATGMLALLPMPLSWLTEVEIRLGMLTEASAHAKEGLRLATDVGQPPRIADFHALLATVAAIQGDAAETREHAGTAKDLAHRTGNRLASARATWALGSLALARGEHDTACALLATLGTRGVPQCHEHIARLALPDTVEAHLRAGDTETATGMVNRFTHWAGDRPGWVRAHLHGCAALLAEGETGSAGLADKLHQSALASVSADSTPFEVARLSLRYGEWLRRQRRITEATEPLRTATNLFTDLGARSWAERAGGELRACGARSGGVANASSWPKEELTEQETRVAELAALGLSNREIGAKLYLSHRTVGYHLHKIFPKLGITTRAQLRQTPLAPEDPR
ncbi:hypothetical protein BAY61_07105 [Prauserella marina]|uniref:ATP-, maltotriose-and DNA-dependent transcriptional regulator MalT n=1 Tax=Prauserella marina TaxID=530584 RepID=A0A222VLR7_9PSEU|nr:LuxR family transcriptional regulator [Prauserella marina]ASR34782.1 hypothetical protein BAY61_07105 [Prauserella marina]PWV85536.1 ATP/maltotriose-dependent transcriptional regulator MalT [Prauserella marina]SDC52525.1 ATP-, maltotriose-and DNA-dependent transcriptional regulator MalT [Prauserella marina]